VSQKRKYIYENRQIKEEISAFKTWLQSKRFAKDTIRSYANYAAYFLNWLEKEKLTIETVNYNHILDFIDYCHSDGKSTRNINCILTAIKHFYNFKNITNPASGLYLKGVPRTIPHNLLDFETLENLYHDYKTYDHRTHRNRVMLGLMVYHATGTDELRKLEITDVRLKEGKIFIPGSKRSNSRTLKLEPFQILELKEYLEVIRSEIVKEQTRQLFVSMEGSKNIKNSIYHLFRYLKKLNPKIKNTEQIRQSVISHWLTEKDLRTVQYMCGHRYVSSTERYKTNNLTDLKEALNKYHPLSNEALF
jgi:integrase/recombinase XerD